MEDTGVIDQFLAVFSTYIDSGFGLLGGEVGFLSSTLIVIDVTIAALFWAWLQMTCLFPSQMPPFGALGLAHGNRRRRRFPRLSDAAISMRVRLEPLNRQNFAPMATP
ncbi:hypothetical protein ATE69_17950 [Sphingopyxis sp. H071]|nr:hypothetical protein ATE61_16260 [Sphingopyxis sp. H057]KTE50234.1 hypothetical protein ATE64_17470 [Sphingopyxis sp. H073]KTE50621.1 hypothetical protein ATE69_17950 [Sphingopyxis sp. H071]KTE59909.1 hypothetical protein ATE66_09970 [Sphingopyxis sp. H107]KTE63690.1 hypothetical protein ATE65_14655 [Sphingopyxis sp. H100]KTE71782.1 hypothetical protein ATE60_13095 [Sphingopyxis sp. H081]KTE82540.1 hypothetical protein ATE63_00425 [Sphingopyxis sp. H067]